jgi:hypothetical protein
VRINETLETKEGTVQFKGEISGKELDLVIQTGLLTLMQRGVIAAVVSEKEEYEGEIH